MYKENKMSLGVDPNQLKSKSKSLTSLLEDINKLASTALSFGSDIPTELHLIVDYVDQQLREKFIGGEAQPNKIADIIGKEYEYNLVNQLWLVIKTNPEYEAYKLWLRFKDGKYVYDEELEDILKRECENWLEGETPIKVYNQTVDLINLFHKIYEVIGQKDLMKESKKFAKGFQFLVCANDFVLRPNISVIKELAQGSDYV